MIPLFCFYYEILLTKLWFKYFADAGLNGLYRGVIWTKKTGSVQSGDIRDKRYIIVSNAGTTRLYFIIIVIILDNCYKYL
ncbi:hypothetical protein DF182_23445 [Chitinophaga flava]|uniref:Uncharacterized protein n=1 Tax=Chitinophaga flava TaxID=2259036 RepID=A0A365XT11_9BACT|nr:hypothetical protein DF182_23445 [Chitinophaga flava]